MLTANASLSYTATLRDKIDGKDIYLVTLKNGSTTVRITNIGCSITAIQTPDRNGLLKNIVAGFDDPIEYLRNPWYFGCVVGRYVNRIGGAMFYLDGKPIHLSGNDGDNHLHGGFAGFHKKIWDLSGPVHNAQEVGVVLEYTSPDGEEGYPGSLRVQVRYTLDPDSRLRLTYTATTDKSTPVNLSNHTYFNLSGFDDPVIGEHELMVHAKGYTEKYAHNLPTGRILPVSGTSLDLSAPIRLGDRIDAFPADKGFDHNYVIDRTGSSPAHEGVFPAAALCDPASGRVLRVFTDQPGIQVYTANWWDGTIHGAHAQPYRQHGAVALETQAFPDSPNRPEFPDTILRPGEAYQANTIFEFSNH